MALFPKNLVWRHSDAKLRDLRAWMASFPDVQAKPGELFIIDGEDSYGEPHVSLLTYDEFHQEVASAFGTLDQLAQATYKKRGGFAGWGHNSALMWTEDRVRIYEDTFTGVEQSELIGDGWQVYTPFPYNLSDSSIDDFYDVFLYLDQDQINEGDNIEWTVLESGRGVFRAVPGLGNGFLGIDPSANLDDTFGVVYSEPMLQNSKLVFDFVDQKWRNEYTVPLLATRTDVDPLMEPEDTNVLSYSEEDDYWTAKEAAQEGVLTISDGRRTVDKSNEYIVLPGRIESLDPNYTDEFSRKRIFSEPTEKYPYGFPFELLQGDEIRAEGVTNDFWERFPGGSIWFQDLGAMVNGAFRSGLRMWRSSPDRDPSQVQQIDQNTFNTTGQYQGDYTVQAWFRIEQETLSKGYGFIGRLIDVPARDADSSIQVSLTYRESDRPTSPEDPDRVTLSLIYSSTTGNTNSFYIILDQDIRIGVDYHVAVQFERGPSVVNAWVNGVTTASIEVENAGYGEVNRIGAAVRETIFGEDYIGYMADMALTLQAEYRKGFIERSEWKKDFNPPVGWGRNTLEGPKAALKTLGVTTTGLFGWISKESPYKWTAAFGGGLFNSFSQSLAVDKDNLQGGQVLRWDKDRAQFVGGGASVSGNQKITKAPGTPRAYSETVMWSADRQKDFASINSGFIRPVGIFSKNGSLYLSFLVFIHFNLHKFI